MGLARNREPQLSKPEALGSGGLVPGASHYLSSTLQALHSEALCTPPSPKPQLRHSEVCYHSRYL